MPFETRFTAPLPSIVSVVSHGAIRPRDDADAVARAVREDLAVGGGCFVDHEATCSKRSGDAGADLLASN